MPHDTAAPAELLDAIEEVRLIDHHVHGPYAAAPSRTTFGDALIEADTDPQPDDLDPFDTQLGFALRAWCAPVLGLPRHAHPDAYWAARSALGEDEVARRFLHKAGVSDWLVDTGYSPAPLRTPAQLSAVSGVTAHRIVRLESVLEDVARAGIPAAGVHDEIGAAVAAASADAVAAKTIAAYRCGFAADLSRPSDGAVRRAYAEWVAGSAGREPRVTSPVLIACAINAALELGLPLQIHVGLGDRDLHLASADPLLLTDFLRTPQARHSPILLLHCYPYERSAGYLASAFANVFLDVGLAVNHLGARSTGLVARAFELAPFAKLLYSSDAIGPPELHYLGARLWRTALARVLGRFVADDDWSVADALRVSRLVCRDNALRAYPRLAGT